MSKRPAPKGAGLFAFPNYAQLRRAVQLSLSPSLSRRSVRAKADGGPRFAKRSFLVG
jgi:hypothetical protein